MAAILPAGDALYTYTYLIELNKIFYEYEIKYRDKKSSPKNIVKPRTREEVKTLLFQQKTVLEKNIFLFDDVSSYLNTSSESLDNFNYYISEIMSLLNKDFNDTSDNSYFKSHLSNIIQIFKNSSYDNTKVFKFVSNEDLEVQAEDKEDYNKLTVKNRTFKKTFKPKLNKFVQEGKKIVFTGLADEPYFRLPIPADIPYKESELSMLSLENNNKHETIEIISTLKHIYNSHKDYVKGYNSKILSLKNKLINTMQDIAFTSKELDSIKQADSLNDVKFNFTYNSFFPLVEKGMLYNFIA